MSIDLGKAPMPGKPPSGGRAQSGRLAIGRLRRSAADHESGSWRGTVSALGVVTIVAYGVAEYSYGVLIDPIHAHTGWSTPALGAIFSAVLMIGGAGGLAGGRLVDRLGTRPAFLLAGTVGAGAVALASYQSSLLRFAALYASGCGVIAGLGYYHVTQPAAIRGSSDRSGRAVVWLTIFGAFASPIFLPLTAALVTTVGWRATIRVLAAIASGVSVAAAWRLDRRHQHPPGHLYRRARRSRAPELDHGRSASNIRRRRCYRTRPRRLPVCSDQLVRGRCSAHRRNAARVRRDPRQARPHPITSDLGVCRDVLLPIALSR